MENIKAINCLNGMQARSIDTLSLYDTSDAQFGLVTEDIEALNIAISAISYVEEINTPKMVYKKSTGDLCPGCGKYLALKDVSKCYWCGQSLMWDDRKIAVQEVIVFETSCDYDSEGEVTDIECQCPRCGYDWMNSYPPEMRTFYCPSCGQKLNWPNEVEI